MNILYFSQSKSLLCFLLNSTFSCRIKNHKIIPTKISILHTSQYDLNNSEYLQSFQEVRLCPLPEEHQWLHLHFVWGEEHLCAMLLEFAQMARPVSSNQQIVVSLFFGGLERLLIAYDVLRAGKVWKTIFRHGFGNWNEIADYIDTNKTR